ncbi:MAG TPA: hypothetical protein VKS81_06635 [Bacteroidota bacterium]|nr:hypothetical protein [Bacteroidota bacterium]
MAVTVLAIVFLLGMLATIVFGFKYIMRPGSAPAESAVEKCSLCRKTFNKTDLILRQVGDYKLVYFCASCIESLNAEAKAKYN